LDKVKVDQFNSGKRNELSVPLKNVPEKDYGMIGFLVIAAGFLLITPSGDGLHDILYLCHVL
jgi:hypothetical protein